MDESYRDVVIKTARKANVGNESELLLASLGLVIESSEFADFLKKELFHNQKLDKENMVRKLGDIRWFLEYAAEAIGVSMEEIEQKNIKKLMTRYLEAFKK